MEQVRQGLIAPLAPHSLAVHPVPIILSLNGLGLFVVFSALWRRGRLAPGRLFLSFWAVFAFSRFWLDFLRGSHRTLNWGILSDGQVMALVVFLVASGVIVAMRRQGGAGGNSWKGQVPSGLAKSQRGTIRGSLGPRDRV